MSISCLLPKSRCVTLAGRAIFRYCHTSKTTIQRQDVSALTSAPTQPGALRRVLHNVNVIIEELSHMDEVRAAQMKVIQIKDKLFESSQQKREIQHKLSDIRRDLKRVHADSVAIGRGTEGYLTLVHSEINLLKDEDQQQAAYSRVDEEERNLFTHLTAAINDAYEKEKVHSNTLRLWALIGTILTSFITLILSSVGHYHHTTQIGLVGSKLKDADSIFNEIRSQREILLQLQQFHQSKEQAQPAARQQSTQGESWGAYLSRHASRPYRYFFPKM